MSSTVHLLVLALLVNQVTAQEQVYAREVWRRRWNSGRRAIFGGQGNNGLMKGREEVFKRQEMETVVSGSSPTTTVDALVGSETVATSAGVANSIPTSMPTNQAFTGVDSRALAATTVATTITTCDPTYTGGGFTISGTGTLPSPTAFVKKAARSQQLTVNNQPYRIVGPNIYVSSSSSLVSLLALADSLASLVSGCAKMKITVLLVPTPIKDVYERRSQLQ